MMPSRNKRGPWKKRTNIIVLIAFTRDQHSVASRKAALATSNPIPQAVAGLSPDSSAKEVRR
jgi:hypothetical protein